METTYFEQLFEYSHTMNQKYIELFLRHKEQWDTKGVQVLNHILNAHQIWIARVLNQATFGVWQVHAPEDLPVISDSNHRDSLHILASRDLSSEVTYMNTKKHTFHSSIRDILFHIINHSTYHRGQLAILCRMSEIAPPATEYIFHRRTL